MAKYQVITYTDATTLASARAALEATNAIVHKLKGGNRAETVDTSNLTPAQLVRWQAKGGATTTGYSTPVIAPTDPDNPESGGGELRLLIETRLQSELTANGGRLTPAERVTLQTAITNAVDRVRPLPDVAGGRGR